MGEQLVNDEWVAIVGAGREQIAAYQLAKRRGYKVVGTDVDPLAPAFEFADHRILVSTRSAEKTANMLANFANSRKFVAAITLANDVPYTVAMVARALNVPGLPVSVAKRFLDKRVMKQFLRSGGAPVTPHQEVLTVADLLRLRGSFADLEVLKPVDGRGSRGVLLLDDQVDLDWAFHYSMSESPAGALLLEPFLAGPQLSVEGVFVDGHFHAVAFADRNYSNLDKTRPFVVEDGGLIPSVLDRKTLHQIEGILVSAAAAIGLNWGTMKADIVVGPIGPCIIELAARLSGNNLATEHIPAAYGVDILSLLFDQALGRPIKAPHRQEIKQWFAVRYLGSTDHGTLREISGLDDARNVPGTRAVEVNVRPGEKIGPARNHSERLGSVMVGGSSPSEAVRRAETAISYIKLRVLPHSNGTDSW